MTILLTRPAGRNQAVAKQLAALGYASIETPLMQLTAYDNQQRHLLEQADLVIFVSANAVQFAAQQLSSNSAQANWPTTCLYFGVGQATSQAILAQGLIPLQPAEDNQQSEGLLVLPELQQVQGKRVLIIRGRGGRTLLADTLTARGATVDYWEVYQRCCPEYDGQSLVQQWQNAGVNTILLTSPEMIDSLIQLIPKELFSWLQSCHIIVPSHRAEALAIHKGLTYVTNAGGANTSAMLTALK